MAYNKDLYGDNSSPVAKPLADKSMKQIDKSDITTDINGAADSRVNTDVDASQK